MTASNATIRQTIYDAVGDLSGVNRYLYPPESIQVPAVVVAGLDMKRATYEGGRESTATILVIVSHSDADQLETLDRLLDVSDGSVMAALDATTEVDGVSLAWDSAGSYGEVQWNGVAYYGAVITAKVWT